MTVAETGSTPHNSGFPCNARKGARRQRRDGALLIGVLATFSCLILALGVVRPEVVTHHAGAAGSGVGEADSSAAGYPRIANIYGTCSADKVRLFSAYDLFIPYSWGGGPSQTAALRMLNPRIKILLSLDATQGPLSDPLTVMWMAARPGDPAYACLLRNSVGAVLRQRVFGDLMFNLTSSYCRDVLVRRHIAAWRATAGEYDGLYSDKLIDEAPFMQLGDDIDADLDGMADQHETLDAAYKAGVEDYLSRMRAALPDIIIMGNDAPNDYKRWLNGRFVEWELAYILDGRPGVTWQTTLDMYRFWAADNGFAPNTTFIGSSPEKAYERKYVGALRQVPPAMEAEWAANYQAMRYGLVTALLGDGMFCYDFGGFRHGDVWWYDEFGRRSLTLGTAKLPGRGYLGRPVDDPRQLMPGVWARKFESGIAVINTTLAVKTVNLGGSYRKIDGAQAPLFQIRVDDDAAVKTPGWTQEAANYRQFGMTVHMAAGTDRARTVTYTPDLAYAGEYEVWAWVVPAPGQSGAAAVTMHHSGGDTNVALDETSGAIGWHKLGKFQFAAGTSGYARLAATGAGTVVADAFKWVSAARYNDGTVAGEITLQSEDGIILLSTIIE